MIFESYLKSPQFWKKSNRSTNVDNVLKAARLQEKDNLNPKHICRVSGFRMMEAEVNMPSSKPHNEASPLKYCE